MESLELVVSQFSQCSWVALDLPGIYILVENKFQKKAFLTETEN